MSEFMKQAMSQMSPATNYSGKMAPESGPNGTGKAKFSRLLILQRKINRDYGHKSLIGSHK